MSSAATPPPLQGLRERRAARILLLDSLDRVLLLHYRFTQGALAGQNYWATPGGGVEGDETFPQAAERELYEETGLTARIASAPVLERRFAMVLTSGERVAAHEQFFLLRVAPFTIDTTACTAEESRTIDRHHWWSSLELGTTSETVWPQNLLQLMQQFTSARIDDAGIVQGRHQGG